MRSTYHDHALSLVRDDPAVDGGDVGGGLLPRYSLGISLSLGCQLAAEGLVVDELRDRVGESVRVPALEQQPVDPVLDHVGHPARVAAHGGYPGSHGLQDNVPQGLKVGGEDKNIGGRVGLRQLLPRPVDRLTVHPVVSPMPGLPLRAQVTPANKGQVRVGDHLENPREKVQPLLDGQSPHVDDQRGVRVTKGQLLGSVGRRGGNVKKEKEA